VSIQQSQKGFHAFYRIGGGDRGGDRRQGTGGRDRGGGGDRGRDRDRGREMIVLFSRFWS
jgi:hypothetical protein